LRLVDCIVGKPFTRLARAYNRSFDDGSAIEQCPESQLVGRKSYYFDLSMGDGSGWQVTASAKMNGLSSKMRIRLYTFSNLLFQLKDLNLNRLPQKQSSYH
jgi:hypothetical protein